MNLQSKNIGIIGVGLIGGSIAMAIRKFNPNTHIFGICHSENSNKKMLHRRIVHGILKMNRDSLEKLDLLIIASPISEVISILESIEKRISKKILVMDVGSTKNTLCTGIQKRAFQHIDFIGTHPMAGSEQSGLSHARSTLFVGKKWVLTPLSLSKDRNIAMVKAFIKSVGAIPVVMSSQKHDHLMSFASHLPGLVSTILMNTIGNEKESDEILKLASSGFIDTTRLASQNTKMKLDILESNKDEIIHALSRMRDMTDHVLQLLRMDQMDIIHNLMIDTKTKRDKWMLRGTCSYESE